MCRIETGFWLVLLGVVHLSPGTVQANRSFKSLFMSLRSTFETACGIPKYNYRNGRIIGGTTSGYGQYPWQINLYQRKSPFQKCGGALLNRHWVVTAAHCVDEFEAQDILVLIGAYNLAEEAHSFVVRKAGIIVVHPLFNPDTYENDVALLRFINPVPYQANIIPVCLPEENSDFEGQMARISGWGRLFYDGPFPTKLQHASIPVIANSDCEQMYRSVGYENLSIPHIFVCAGHQDGKTDACAGDSGSPLVIRRKDQWVLAGIASWGIGCGERNKPGVYTRISEFLDWIKQFIVL